MRATNTPRTDGGAISVIHSVTAEIIIYVLRVFLGQYNSIFHVIKGQEITYPAPDTNRKTMNWATWTDPARTAPAMMMVAAD